MNITENIGFITAVPEKWQLFTNRSYMAQIQKADPSRVYNVPNQKGVVYNQFEDAHEKVTAENYIITGVAGEMWPISAKNLPKYDIKPENITYEPQSVATVETGTVLAGIRIPTATEFMLQVDYGEKCWLKGNRPDSEHGKGDWILVNTTLVNGIYVPNFSDSGRIVNGSIFEAIYKPY